MLWTKESQAYIRFLLDKDERGKFIKAHIRNHKGKDGTKLTAREAMQVDAGMNNEEISAYFKKNGMID